MHVELGNTNPTSTASSPCVTYVSVPDFYTYEVADSASDLAVTVLRDIMIGDPRVTHMPGQEAAVAVFNAWASEGDGQPTWVWSDNDDFATLLGHIFACPVGRPADLEDTHYSYAGAPGVHPAEVSPDVED